LERLLRYLEEPGRLPQTRGVALFACGRVGLFEAVPLPRCTAHGWWWGRSAARSSSLEQEFGTILVVACDRTSALFRVTAFGIAGCRA
jgi:hypothetical protein